MSNTDLNETLKNTLKRYGLKVTQARLLILTELKKSPTPINAENIFKKIGKKKIDLATIYRNIETFLDKKIIRKVDLGKNFISYELNNDHHHHIVCQRCGFIEDFKLPGKKCRINDLSEKVLRSTSSFKKTLEHSFELFGICIKCEK